MTPWTTPTEGGQAFSRAFDAAGKIADRATEENRLRRAEVERARALQLERDRLAETARGHRATEATNRGILGESRRSAIERESHNTEKLKFDKLKDLTTVWKTADAMYQNGNEAGAKSLLELQGVTIGSAADIEDHLSAQKEVIDQENGRRLATGQEPTIPPEAPLLEQAAAMAPMAQGLAPELADPFPGGAVPRGTMPAGAPAPDGGMSAAQVPASTGDIAPPDIPLPGDPRLSAPAYDAFQVPAGMAPSGMNRQDYMAAERAREPASAHVPAGPALPGDPLTAMVPEFAKIAGDAGSRLAEMDQAGQMQVTTPDGRKVLWNPGAAGAKKRAAFKKLYEDRVNLVDPELEGHAWMQAETAADVLAARGGNADLAAADMLEQDKLATQLARTRMGVAMSRAARLAKDPDELTKVQRARIRAEVKKSTEHRARTMGYTERRSSITTGRQVLKLLATGREGMSAEEMSLVRGQVMRMTERGAATEGDIMRSTGTDMKPIGQRVKEFFHRHIGEGGLTSSQVENLRRMVLKLQDNTFDGMQSTADSLSSSIGDSETDVEASAISSTIRDLYGGYGIRPKLRGKQEAPSFAPGGAREPPVMDREAVMEEGKAIEMAHGLDAAIDFFADHGLEHPAESANRLLEAVTGAVGAP